MVRVLDQAIAIRDRPTSVTRDYGQIESFTGYLRDDCLNVQQFFSLDDARVKLEAWRRSYNEHRPLRSLRHLLPFDIGTPTQVQRT